MVAAQHERSAGRERVVAEGRQADVSRLAVATEVVADDPEDFRVLEPDEGEVVPDIGGEGDGGDVDGANAGFVHLQGGAGGTAK